MKSSILLSVYLANTNMSLKCHKTSRDKNITLLFWNIYTVHQLNLLVTSTAWSVLETPLCFYVVKNLLQIIIFKPTLQTGTNSTNTTATDLKTSLTINR